MPFARIKPLNDGLGYKLRSYSAGSDIRMQIGPNPEKPLWYEITEDQAEHLREQRVNPRDPSSPCKFDILATKAMADAFMLAEAARKKESAAGTSVAEAIPLSPELAAKVKARETAFESLKSQHAASQARVRELEAMLEARGQAVPPPEVQEAPEAFEPPEVSPEVKAALAEQGEPAAKPTAITSAATAAVKRATPKRS